MTTTTQDPMADMDPKIRAMIPPGVDIYDAFMGSIEPELLSVNLPLLDKKYAKESKADHKKRMERYKEAYEKYDATLKAWLTQLDKEVNEQRSSALKDAEVQMEEVEIGMLSQLESSMDELETPTKDSSS